MSLAPGEQRALAGIENALCHSDPRLATMLTTFTPPRTLRLRIRGERLARSQVSRIVAVTVALAAMCVSVLGWLLPAQHGPPACPPGSRLGACQRVVDRASRPVRSPVGAGRPGAQTAAGPGAARPRTRGAAPVSPGRREVTSPSGRTGGAASSGSRLPRASS